MPGTQICRRRWVIASTADRLKSLPRALRHPGGSIPGRSEPEDSVDKPKCDLPQKAGYFFGAMNSAVDDFVDSDFPQRPVALRQAERNPYRLSQRNGPHQIPPLLGFRRAPDQQKFIDGLPDGQALRHEDQTRTGAMDLEEISEVPGHGLEIVRHNDAVLLGCQRQHVRIRNT
jgi:hypothetical protein